jgi:hypothetical protein
MTREVVAQLPNVDYLEGGGWPSFGHLLGRTIVRHSARRSHPPFVAPATEGMGPRSEGAIPSADTG